MTFPAGHVFRHRSTADAEAFSDGLDVKHVRRGREITLEEPAELTKAGRGKPTATELQVLFNELENLRRHLLVNTGSADLPTLMQPIGRVIDRLKATAQ